jgi:hypothetical protein
MERQEMGKASIFSVLSTIVLPVRLLVSFRVDTCSPCKVYFFCQNCVGGLGKNKGRLDSAEFWLHEFITFQLKGLISFN